MERRNTGKNVVNSLAMVLQFSLNMLVPICLMSALGYFLDKKLGTSFIIIVFFFIGAIAGGRNIYKMAMSGIGGSDKRKKTGTNTDEKDS